MSDKKRRTEELISTVNSALGRIATIPDESEFQVQLEYMASIEPIMRELIMVRRRLFIGGSN